MKQLRHTNNHGLLFPQRERKIFTLVRDMGSCIQVQQATEDAVSDILYSLRTRVKREIIDEAAR